MNIKNLVAAGGLALFLTSTGVLANTIDFEDLSGTAGNCDSIQLTTGGFTFDTGFSQCSWNSATQPTTGADNGTNYLINGFSLLHMASLSIMPFNISSLDLGISFYNADVTDSVVLTGNLSGGGTVTQTVDLSQNFQTFTLSGFNNLVSLDISPFLNDPGYIAVDNIVIDNDVPEIGTTVPEPSTIPLYLIGVASIYYLRPKKQRLLYK